MAVKTKKDGPKKQEKGRRKPPLAILFWAAFFIIIFGLFVISREQIRENLEKNNVRLPFIGGAEKTDAPAVETEPSMPVIEPAKPVGEPAGKDPAAKVPVEKPPASQREPVKQEEKPAAAKPAESAKTAAEKTSTAKTPSSTAAEKPAASAKPAGTPAAKSPPAKAAPQAKPKIAARIIYFMQVSGAGKIIRVPVTRQLPASDSPMLDALNALLAGPGPAEKERGMLNLIPDGSRILGIQVQGHTAYINFNEEFMYNTYGVEGYAAQLRQVVWTATEFANVTDVQILIEGRRIDYLGEGIWIGSPLSREE